MLIVYNLLIRIYYFCIFFTALFHWKAKKYIFYRFGWRKNLKKSLSNSKQHIWIYSPSIGEYQECRKFVKRIIEIKNNDQFIFTFHSPSGYDQAVFPTGDTIRLMLPLDTKKNADKFLNIVNPKEVYILSTGIWPNYIMNLQKRKIPHYLISFYGRDDSFFFKPVLRSFYKPFFSSFKTIFCYNNHCKFLLKKHFNYNKIVVVGNLRFDCVLDMKINLRKIEGIEQFIDGEFCFVSGSTEKKENELLIRSFRRLKHLNIKWIIVPHEKLKSTLKRFERLLGDDMCFYSKNLNRNMKVLVYDRTGDLFQLYQYADLCMVGRGFHRLEIHNMLEPAVFLKSVLIGPKHKKFVEPSLFIRKNIAFEYRNEKELCQLIFDHYNANISVNTKAIQKIFNTHSGGTEIVLNTLNMVSPIS